MQSRLRARGFCAVGVLSLMSLACSDKSPVEPAAPPKSPAAVSTFDLVVSDPFLGSEPSSAAAQAGGARSSISSEAGVTYVSLPTGSEPKGVSVTIRNVTSGALPTQPQLFLDGGFDPVRVAAKAGDELEIAITRIGGGITVSQTRVPSRRPPRVVRTNPPGGMVDVALNSRVLIVFSEPIASATLTTASVRLLQGTTPVSGTVRVVTETMLEAEFVPDEDLVGGATYTFIVTQNVLDADGDALETTATTEFTAVTAVTTAPSVFSTIVAGAGHTCSLLADGKAFCWGGNFAGQLGTGGQLKAFGTCPGQNIPDTYNPFACSNAPTAVVGGYTFASLALGFMHTCALTAAGEAFCWGNNPHGELGAAGAIECNPSNPGDPSPPDKCSPVPLRVSGGLRFLSLVAGSTHTCGLQAGGSAYCWGLGNDGALGTGHIGNVESPAAVIGGLSFISLTAGGDHTCGLTTGGAAYCWGTNDYGQLGVGSVSMARCAYDGSTTVPCVTMPRLVSGGLTFTSLSAGVYHTCGLTTSGRAYCWGTLGTVYSSAEGTYVASPEASFGPVPAPVSGDHVFVSLSTNPTAGGACGITAAGVAYCWGGFSGQVDGVTQSNTLVPARVAGNLAFAAVAGGGAHACGITTDAIVYCWGDNFMGQLGVGNSAPTGGSVPMRVSGQ